MICKNPECINEFDYTYDKIYCSRSCAAKVNNSIRPKRNLTQWKCESCDEVIVRTSWKDRRRFCDECRYSRRVTLAQEARSKKTPKKEKIKVSYTFNCKGCQQPFESSTKTRLYCSKDCRKYVPIQREMIDWESLTIKEVKGEGNANSRSRMPYVRNLARKKYLKSDKPKQCFVCNYDYHFDICHIKDVHQYHDDALIREVNHIDNLVALCKNHHWEFDNGYLSI